MTYGVEARNHRLVAELLASGVTPGNKESAALLISAATKGQLEIVEILPFKSAS